MTPLEDRLRAAIRAKADEIRADAPPLRLPPAVGVPFFSTTAAARKRERWHSGPGDAGSRRRHPPSWLPP